MIYILIFVAALIYHRPPFRDYLSFFPCLFLCYHHVPVLYPVLVLVLCPVLVLYPVLFRSRIFLTDPPSEPCRSLPLEYASI